MARIMYISPVYYPLSSASITTHEVVKGLAEKGHYVDLLVASRCLNGCFKECSFECNRTENINVHRISLLTRSVIESHLSIRLLLFTIAFFPLTVYALVIARKRKFDLVIAMYHVTHLAPFSAFLISRFLKIPLVLKCHDVVASEARRGLLEKMSHNLLSRLNWFAFERAERILILSAELRLLVKKLHKIADERFVILPNGVNTSMFKCNTNYPDVCEKLGAQDKKILLYSGSLAPPYRKKGLRFLIEAMPKIVAKEPRVVLVVIGQVADRVQSELESLATSLNVKEHVRFVEPIPYEAMPMYISIADICIGPLCPSLDTYGSTPRKVLEYLACAKPVIACDGGVARDLIINGYNGLLVRYEDIEDLASSILKLIENPEFAGGMGQNGRSHVMTFYDQRVLTDRLDSEIRNLLSASNM